MDVAVAEPDYWLISVLIRVADRRARLRHLSAKWGETRQNASDVRGERVVIVRTIRVFKVEIVRAVVILEHWTSPNSQYPSYRMEVYGSLSGTGNVAELQEARVHKSLRIC